MKIAVTGAGGFIGGHLTTHLEGLGHQVVTLRRESSGAGFDRLEEHLVDTAAIVHLAARQVDAATTPFADYLPSNVILTETLLQAAAAAGVARFVMASTRLVYPSWINGPVAEDCPYPPDGFYGLSKRVAENLVAIYASRGPMSGLALRIGQVFGAGDRGRGVLPRFIETVRGGEPPTVAGSGAAVRDFVHVDDVVRAFVLAIEKPTSVPAINIGGGRGYSIRELAAAAATAAGMDESTIRSTPVDDDDRSHYSLDCSLAKAQLDWEPQHSLVDAIKSRLAADS